MLTRYVIAILIVRDDRSLMVSGNAGYWLVVIRTMPDLSSSCFTCRNLRRVILEQDGRPLDRAEIAPFFTNLDLDVFRPWADQTRRTKGGVVSSKCWGLVFTFQVSRAIHIEFLETNVSSFICALVCSKAILSVVT